MTAWIPNVVPDEPIESVWGNTIRDRTVTPFANAAARTAGIAVPTEGMISYLADTGALEIYYSATVGWRPPWNTAWGSIARVVNTAISQSGISAETDIPGMTVTTPVVGGRRLEWRWRLSARSAAAEAGGLGVVKLTDNANVGLQDGEFPACQAIVHENRWQEAPVANGSVIRKLRLLRAQGSTTYGVAATATNVAYLICHDIGPAANPA